MSSSEALQELLNYKKDIEKDLEVIYIIINIFINRMKKKLSIY